MLYIFLSVDVKTRPLRDLNGGYCHYFRVSRGYRPLDRIQHRKFVLLVFVTFVNERVSRDLHRLK